MADTIITRGDGNRNPDWPNGLQSAYDGLSSLYSAMLALDSLTSGSGPSAGVLAPLGVDRYEAAALMGAAYNLWRKAEEKLAPAFATWERGTTAAESVAARLDDHLRRLGVPDDADAAADSEYPVLSSGACRVCGDDRVLHHGYCASCLPASYIQPAEERASLDAGSEAESAHTADMQDRYQPALDGSPCCHAGLETIYSPQYTGKGRGVRCLECGKVYDQAALVHAWVHAPIQPADFFDNPDYVKRRLGINA